MVANRPKADPGYVFESPSLGVLCCPDGGYEHGDSR